MFPKNVKYTDITTEEIKAPRRMVSPAEITDGWCFEEEDSQALTHYAVVQSIDLGRAIGYREVSPIFKTHREASNYGRTVYPGKEKGTIREGFKVQRVEGKGRTV